MSVPQPPQSISSPTSLFQNSKLGAVPHQERGKQTLQMGLLQRCPLHKCLTAAASSRSIRVVLPCVLLEGIVILLC